MKLLRDLARARAAFQQHTLHMILTERPMNIPGYDEWKLQGPDEDRHDPVGTEEGETCGRWQEPDEDCPKPWQCKGVMRQEYEDGDFHATWAACDTCGRSRDGRE